MNIKEAIGKIVTGKNLTENEMVAVMNDIMSGSATDAQIGSFITALRLKGKLLMRLSVPSGSCGKKRPLSIRESISPAGQF